MEDKEKNGEDFYTKFKQKICYYKLHFLLRLLKGQNITKENLIVALVISTQEH